MCPHEELCVYVPSQGAVCALMQERGMMCTCATCMMCTCAMHCMCPRVLLCVLYVHACACAPVSASSSRGGLVLLFPDLLPHAQSHTYAATDSCAHTQAHLYELI